MKHGKLKKMEEDLKSCPTVMFRVPVSGGTISSHGSGSKKDHKMPRRIIATTTIPSRSGGSKSPLRNSDTDSISRYSVVSGRSQRRSGGGTVASEGASTVRSRMSIRRGGSCCGYHVPGHVVLGVVIFSVLTLWHHTNYFTPNSYLSPYITAMRDVTAETAQARYQPFENSNQAILQAMDLKTADIAEPQGMKVPHPNAVEMRDFLRKAQSTTQKDMIRMEMLGESTGGEDKQMSSIRKARQQEQRSLQDETNEDEESNAKDDKSSSRKKYKKQKSDEDPEPEEKGRRSSDGIQKAASRKQEPREEDEEDSTNAVGSKPRKNLRSSQSVEKDEVEDEAPARKKSKKDKDETKSSSDEKTEKGSPKNSNEEDKQAVSKEKIEKSAPKNEAPDEDEPLPAHTAPDDPCFTMVTTIDPVKGIIQKKIPLVSCQK